MHRQPLLSPSSASQGGKIIDTNPPCLQTPVGITGAIVHLNPELFPNPLTFEPERFIADPRLKQSLLNFSRGSRQCLGMHVAYAQLYLLTAGIWRRFGGSQEEKGDFGWWELFETDKTDVEMVSALFVPYAKAESKGIRVVIRK